MGNSEKKVKENEDMREAEGFSNRSEETPPNPSILLKIVWSEIYQFHRYLCQSYSTIILWCRSFDRFENRNETFEDISFFEIRQKLI